VSVSTTSVSSILSSLSAGLFTTIVPTSESSRGPKPIFGPQATLGPKPIFGSHAVHGPKPIFGAGCAHLELVPVRATVSAFPRERHMSDVSGYRTDPSISFQASRPFHAPTWLHASAAPASFHAPTWFHALFRALLHKAHYLV